MRGAGSSAGPESLDAGPFGAWAREAVVVIGRRGDADVPCGACTACCTSRQFVHIEPDETATLAHVPKALRFPAPGRPAGHVLLPYDEHGRCPMLVDGACSIYAHRPRTCRTYDCRVFAAADVAVADDKPAIAAQVARWQFGFDDADDRARRAAVLAARDAIAARTGDRPLGPTQLAAAAVGEHEAFLPPAG